MRQRPCVATNSGVEVLERARRVGVHYAVDGHRAAVGQTPADAVLGGAVRRGFRGRPLCGGCAGGGPPCAGHL